MTHVKDGEDGDKCGRNEVWGEDLAHAELGLDTVQMFGLFYWTHVVVFKVWWQINGDDVGWMAPKRDGTVEYFGSAKSWIITKGIFIVTCFQPAISHHAADTNSVVWRLTHASLQPHEANQPHVFNKSQIHSRSHRPTKRSSAPQSHFITIIFSLC